MRSPTPVVEGASVAATLKKSNLRFVQRRQLHENACTPSSEVPEQLLIGNAVDCPSDKAVGGAG
jgi:hypothetical protein